MTRSSFWLLLLVTAGCSSITGIHYKTPLTCDSCRLALPREAVDSIRVRHILSARDRGEMVAVVALGLVALGILHVH
jgi:hypothetical protein